MSAFIPQSADDMALRLALLAGALMLDWLFGEPDILWRRVPHPVVLFGRAINFATKTGNRRKGTTGRQRRTRGVIAIGALVAVAGGVGYLLSFGGGFAELLVLAIMLAGKSLDEHIRDVATALSTGLTDARRALGMIVGRDTSSLGEDEIARAAIETGAENLSDGVIAPAFWFLILGLPGLLIYKMVNTADSMIGYKNARFLAFGWGAAKLDDILNYLPARISGVLICIAAMPVGGQIARAFAVMRADAGSHQSPNAGWPEAAMAGAMDIWLAGPRRYGNRIRDAARMNVSGDIADRNRILTSLKILAIAQILFALTALLLALMIAPDALT